MEVNCTSQQENQWIDMARAGDLPAFNQLVLSYQDAAFRFAKWMVHEDDCAEDIVQTAFLAAFRQLRHLRGNHFRAWLLKMIHNACIDELRRRKCHPSLALEPTDADGETMKTAKWMIDAGQMPEEMLIQHEDSEWVEKCLRRLPEAMREVLILVDMESLDYAEAANTLGIPLGTVKSRLMRARARMRDIVRQAHPEPKARLAFDPPSQ